jgi:mRNA-degrading endonuclease RelE of RelBE toxin-antitoxin system
MNFRIADTFTNSLGKLTGAEQKQVKTTAFDLQINPANPGMSFHKLDGAKDKNFWSVRVSSDIRIIVHKTDASLLLCYVDHHDKAYNWAGRRKLETHPKTGAAQLVEIRETQKEVVVPAYVAEDVSRRSKPRLFDGVSEETLLTYGVPQDWLDDVKAADEDSLLQLADHLPAEAAEALLELATGGNPKKSARATPDADPFEHPDAQRRFRVMANADELALALDYPWDKWTVFLHPAQRELVEKDYSGPARVSGSAGTGKTIVALHRAVYLVRQNPDARVLLTTFSETLANALNLKVRRLISNEPRLAERLDVESIDIIGERLYGVHIGAANIASREQIKRLLTENSAGVEEVRFSQRFLQGELDDVVDAWQLSSWEGYRDVTRLGRKTRLPESQRTLLWQVFEGVKAGLKEQGLLTRAEMFSQLADKLLARNHPPSNLRLLMRLRTSLFRSYVFSLHLAVIAQIACSLPGTWGSGSFRCRSPGNRWVSIFVAGRRPCVLTTAPHTRFACRLIVYSGRTSRMWTATSMTAVAPFQYSTVSAPVFRSVRMRMPKFRP